MLGSLMAAEPACGEEAGGTRSAQRPGRALPPQPHPRSGSCLLSYPRIRRLGSPFPTHDPVRRLIGSLRRPQRARASLGCGGASPDARHEEQEHQR